MMYYNRYIEKTVLKSLSANPVTAILGPRQCGKSTLAKTLLKNNFNDVFLDLERPSDYEKLNDAEWFFTSQKNKLICIDEIQRKPDLFPVIRSLVDEWGGNGHFLILGSASRDLLKQSSESLAGRISYKRLTPFLVSEIENSVRIEEYINKGGFPRSLLADSPETSFNWREDFITTFLERDLQQWAGFASVTMRKLWQMLAYNNGQTVNFSALGNSLNVSHSTIRNYIELLAHTYMLQVIHPYIKNTGKRLVKSPKVYISDAGIANALLGIKSFEQLAGHPSFGAIWESVVLANLTGHFPECDFYFYRTNHGSEIDFIIEYKGKAIAVECINTLSPALTKGTWQGIEDIKPERTLIVAPVKDSWSMKENVDVTSISGAIVKISETLSLPEQSRG